MNLNKDEVCLRLGIPIRKLDTIPELNILKIKEKNKSYWTLESIENYEKEQELKVKKEENKPRIVTLVQPMSPKLRSNFKFWVRNMDGTIIYRKSKDMNEWKTIKQDSNVFNLLNTITYNKNTTVYERLRDLYLGEIVNGETFLLTKTEEFKVPELSQKVTAFYKFISNDVDFFIPSIESFTNDPNVMTYKFFDLNKAVDGEHKHWDIWEQQLKPDDVKVFRAFVYSIYFAKDKNRQVLWLYDSGHRGKTIVMNALTKFGGHHFSNAVKPESLRDKHYGTYIEGYRLILFDDNTNPFLISDGKLKSITGGGQITIDEKGVNGTRSYMPNVKVIISSNMKPIIQNQDSDITRLILMDIQDPTTENKNYMQSVYGLEDILCDELNSYLSTCKKSYEELCLNNTHIQLTEGQMASIINCQNADDSIISNFFNTYFVVSLDKKSHILKTEFDMCKADFESNQNVKMDYAKILKFLGGHDIITKNKKVDNIINTIYMGIELRGWKFDEGRLEIC